MVPAYRKYLYPSTYLLKNTCASLDSYFLWIHGFVILTYGSGGQLITDPAGFRFYPGMNFFDK
jgi:hypothetical protein